MDDVSDVELVARFVEKPDLANAERMLKSGNYLWNAGIFLFRAQDMVDAFSVFAADTLALVRQSISDASVDLGFLRLAEHPWSMLDDISIDYAILEKLKIY